MYAIFATRGKQYNVVTGERLKIDRISGDVGAELQFGEVLYIGGDGQFRIGRPMVAGAKVTAKIVAQDKDDKIRVGKRRKRKGFHKVIGHRQPYTEIEVVGIAG